MRFTRGFFLAEPLKTLRLNLLRSITAVTTTFICILVFGLGLLVSAHIQSIIGSVREDVSVEAFMPNATSQEVDSLANEVETWPEVASVTRVSEEQAFTEGNLSYPQQTIDRLNSITSYVIWGLYGATLLFLVASVLLISNAIRLSIFARRKEIEVMKLVGASDGFVRTPFVFEGLLQAFAGASLAAFAVIWINLLFVDWSHNALPYVPISNGAVNAFSTLLLLIAVGVGIGVIGSFLSVTRFLKKI